MTRIYLDHGATSALDPAIGTEMLAAYQRYYANPSSQHQAGRQARSQIDRMVEGICAAVGAQTGGMTDDRLVLTSGGTEANNLALRGLLPAGGHLLLGQIEHPSITATAQQMASEGYRVSQLTVDRNGLINVDDLRAKLAASSDTRQATRGAADTLVSIMLGNNETGVIQPVDKLATICRQYAARLHTDAVQAIGKIPIEFHRWDVDALTLAAHKCHGPKGIGGLLLRHDVTLTPQLVGGQQQLGFRAGTECPALVTGMGLAILNASRQLEERAAHLGQLRDLLERRLTAELDGLQILGGDVERLPQTSCIAFHGVNRQALFMALDMKGIACSTGSACASGSSEPSPVLTAMGLDADTVDSAVRFSVGMQNTEDEIAEAAERIIATVRVLRST